MLTKITVQALEINLLCSRIGMFGYEINLLLCNRCAPHCQGNVRPMPLLGEVGMVLLLPPVSSFFMVAPGHRTLENRKLGEIPVRSQKSLGAFFF